MKTVSSKWVATMAMAGLAVASGFLPLAFRPSSFSSQGILIEIDQLDFGTAELFDSPERTLEITNPQTIPITVLLEADCSCVEVPLNAIGIERGQTVSVPIKLKRNGAGPAVDGYRRVLRTLNIAYSLNGLRQQTTVGLSGQFFEPVVIDSSACHFELIPFEKHLATISMSSQVESARVEVVTIPSWCESATINWNEDFDAGTVAVLIAPRSDSEQVQGEMVFKINYVHLGESKTADIRIPVTAQVTAPVTMDPPLLVFESGIQRTEVVTIYQGLALPVGCELKLINASSSREELSLEVIEADRPQLAVTYAGQASAAAESAQVTVLAELAIGGFPAFSVQLVLPVLMHR
ncbi:MAG: hypothetical protein KDB22_05360 [Planctomycetales bacterium]|nr:hypothetical protein [Planctomycetales bacterium]